MTTSLKFPRFQFHTFPMPWNGFQCLGMHSNTLEFIIESRQLHISFKKIFFRIIHNEFCFFQYFSNCFPKVSNDSNALEWIPIHWNVFNALETWNYATFVCYREIMLRNVK